MIGPNFSDKTKQTGLITAEPTPSATVFCCAVPESDQKQYLYDAKAQKKADRSLQAETFHGDKTSTTEVVPQTRHPCSIQEMESHRDHRPCCRGLAIVGQI